MNTLYTVLISKTGYYGAQAHSTLDEACLRMEDAIKRTCVVMRDGKTGKRYSLAKVRELRSKKAA